MRMLWQHGLSAAGTQSALSRTSQAANTSDGQSLNHMFIDRYRSDAAFTGFCSEFARRSSSIFCSVSRPPLMYSCTRPS